MRTTTPVYQYSKADTLTLKYDYNVKERDKLHLKLNNNPKISEDDIREIRDWKCNRILDISPDVIQSLSDLAQKKGVTIDSEKGLITRLFACIGVGIPVASAILKFIRPDIFPIIDVRAYRVLYGITIRSDQYSVELYIEYAKRIKEIADEHNICLCKVDEQLYLLDKDKNIEI